MITSDKVRYFDIFTNTASRPNKIQDEPKGDSFAVDKTKRADAVMRQ